MTESTIPIWLTICLFAPCGVLTLVAGILLMVDKNFDEHRRRCSGITEEDSDG